MIYYPTNATLIQKHRGLPCPYCARPMVAPSRDHIFPRARGFTFGCLDGRNRVIVCRTCNSDKGGSDIFQWIDKLRRGRDPRVTHIESFIASWGTGDLPKIATVRPTSARAGNALALADECEANRRLAADWSATATMALSQRILREGKAKVRADLIALARIEWPWLRELVSPLVHHVGLGPWEDQQ